MNKIREARLLRRLSQKELAEKLNVSQGAVSQWENDVSYPDITTLSRLSDELRISIDSLVGNEAPILTQEVLKEIFGTIDVSEEMIAELKEYAKFIVFKQRRARY